MAGNEKLRELSWRDLADALEKHKPDVSRRFSLAELTYMTRDLNALLAQQPAPEHGTYSELCCCGHPYAAHIPACDDMSGDESCKCKEFEPRYAAAPAEKRASRLSEHAALELLVKELDWYAGKFGLGPVRLQYALAQGHAALGEKPVASAGSEAEALKEGDEVWVRGKITQYVEPENLGIHVKLVTGGKVEPNIWFNEAALRRAAPPAKDTQGAGK